MNDDLISRQAAIETLLDERLITAAAYIERMPTAEKKGTWIVQINGWGDVYFECSCCKEAVTLIDGSPKDNHYYYCPHCGARMEE